jgi:photosystem II stability/assembly factor-like uncharacterized protein
MRSIRGQTMRHYRSFALLLLCLALPLVAAAQWVPLGPEGGDARALAYDPENPDRIYLGTSAGQLYVSRDNGVSWARLASFGEGSDYVLDNIAVDPADGNTLYVAAWSDENAHGDLFRTRDGGRTWQALPAMHGRSIRAMAMAPSDPRTLVVGALDGVFRSHDGGDTWERISPAGHPEIKNIESLAVDPQHPDTIFAGTWHLPWKTTDGGRSWYPIKKGVIDDSDVFSIIVDPTDPSVVYASACSGIYKSEDAAASFRKIQGIPSSARRTRVLQQDPANPAVVYAGTTEGLWKTTDAGHTWKRMTSANVIVNDVLVDPRRPARVLLATDRSGVLASDDAGQSFVASNRGFSRRQVAAFLVDRSNPNTFYAGVVNDKEYGGLFATHDGGATWQQMNDGLGGQDIFTLGQAPNGDLVAGSSRGLWRYSFRDRRWRPSSLLLREKTVPVRTVWKKGKKEVITRTDWVKSELTARVVQLVVMPEKWYAATSGGFFTSLDQGKSWTGGAVLGAEDFVALDAFGESVLAATSGSVLLSRNRGDTWTRAQLPDYVTVIYGVALAPDALWIATREGAFFSRDDGRSWEHIVVGIPARNLLRVNYDPDGRRLLGATVGQVFESRDGGAEWTPVGGPTRLVRSLSVAGNRILAITAFDGIFAQPTVGFSGEQSTAISAGSMDH